MSTLMDKRAPATTFLVHLFGRGLVDEGRCYAVERFVSLSNGDIRRRPAEAPWPKKTRKRPKPEVATFDEVRDMRPAYNEIIVCTALGTRSGLCGVPHKPDDVEFMVMLISTMSSLIFSILALACST